MFRASNCKLCKELQGVDVDLSPKIGDPEIDGSIFESNTRFCGVPKHWSKSWDLEVRSKILEHKSGSVSLVGFFKILDIFIRVSKVRKLILVSLTPQGVNNLVFVCQISIN